MLKTVLTQEFDEKGMGTKLSFLSHSRSLDLQSLIRALQMHLLKPIQ